MSLLASAVFTGYLTLAVIIIILKLTNKRGVELLLSGLRSFYCVDPSSLVQQPTAEELRTKKGRKLHAKQQLVVKGQSLQIFSQGLGQNALRTLLFSDDISALVVLSLCLLINGVLVVAAVVLTGALNTNLVVPVAVSLFLFTVFSLIKVETTGQSVGGVDRSLLLTFTMAGLLVSMLSLMRLPNVRAQGGGLTIAPNSTEGLPLMEWQLKEAAAGFDAITGSLAAKASKRLARLQDVLGAEGVPSMDPNLFGEMLPWSLALGVSVVAGVLAAALLGPAMRYSRLLCNAMNVPAWGKQWIGHKWLAIKIMQLGFAAPVFVVLLQFQPISARWGISVESLPVVSAVLLLLVGLLHILALHPLTQAYLNSGLVTWHTLSHNDVPMDNKQSKVAAALNIHRAWLGKAAMHLASPSLLACSMGILILTGGSPMNMLASKTTGLRAAFHEKLPPALVPYFNATSAQPDEQLVTKAALTVNVPPTQTIPDVVSADADADVDVTVGNQFELEGLGEDETKPTISQTEKPAKTQESSGPGNPQHLWQFLGQFLGWWTCTVWCIYAYSSLLVYKLGLDQGM